jgi:cytochrome c oxidase cbb3-type subunit III
MRGAAMSLILLAVALGACRREERAYRLDPPALEALDAVALMPGGISGAPPDVYVAMGRSYETNALNLSQGKKLYDAYNCRGCHADGGGANGPAFLDGRWRYGADPASVYSSIRDGRANGMPPFRDRLTQEQIWQLAGYVRTIGQYSAPTGATSRNDQMQSRPSENRGPAASQPRDPGSS